MTKLRVLDLFSGIGGFSLGLERAGGFETVAFCEIEEYPRKVLAKHWPGVPIYEDVRTLTASTLARDGIAVDVICGGFPCQDISFAGRRAGLEGARSGLWVEYARLIGELRPRYVIVENVPGLLSLGMGTVLGDLAALGYNATWDCIPAAAVGAPHRRDRVWIVAYAPRDIRRASGNEIDNASDGAGSDASNANCDTRDQWRPKSAGQQRKAGSSNGRGHVANTSGMRLQDDQGRGTGTKCNRNGAFDGGGWTDGRADNWRTEPDVCGMVDGISPRLDGDLNASHWMGANSNAPKGYEGKVREMWEVVASRAAPQGRRSDEQLARELGNALCSLSHGAPLAEWKNGMAAASRYVSRLRQACEASGAVRNTSQPLDETWRSLSCEEANRWHMAAYGRTDWACGEWLGVARVAHGIPHRVHRLRGLGNAVVPQIPELIGRAIMQAVTA